MKVKKVLSILVAICLLVTVVASSTLVTYADGSNATTLEELSAQMFDYFGGTEEVMQYFPPDVPPIIFGDYTEVNDVVIFNAFAAWMGADCVEVSERFGDWCVYSGGSNYPSETAMYVRKDGEIYTLKEAWDSGIVTDLSPAIGFSKYTRVYPVGDADLDYEVSVLDATLIQMEVAKTAPTGIQSIFEVNDVDNDRKVTIMDATAIQRKLAQIS